MNERLLDILLVDSEQSPIIIFKKTYKNKNYGHFPPDIFAVLAENLNLEDIIHLAFSNSKIKAILMSPDVNTQLALSLYFPYNLTFDELVKYKNMSLRRD